LWKTEKSLSQSRNITPFQYPAEEASLRLGTFFGESSKEGLVLFLGLQVAVNPLRESELIFYGGEYYNGDKVSCTGTVFFWEEPFKTESLFCAG
jgi:hypothetical protein